MITSCSCSWSVAVSRPLGRVSSCAGRSRWSDHPDHRRIAPACRCPQAPQPPLKSAVTVPDGSRLPTSDLVATLNAFPTPPVAGTSARSLR